MPVDPASPEFKEVTLRERRRHSVWLCTQSTAPLSNARLSPCQVAESLVDSIGTAAVVSVRRVEDRQLWRKYFEKQRDVENSRLNGSSGANELRMLWHGTGQINPEVTTAARVPACSCVPSS